MFLKKCRAFKLDATGEFFKQAGILYSGDGTGDNVDDDDDNNDDNDDNDGNRDNDSDDDNAPGYAFF